MAQQAIAACRFSVFISFLFYLIRCFILIYNGYCLLFLIMPSSVLIIEIIGGEMSPPGVN